MTEGSLLQVPDFPVDPALHEHVPVGGRLQIFYKNWEKIGAHPFVIQVLRDGYKLEFASTPPLTVKPPPLLRLPPDQQQILDTEMQKFVDNNVLEPVPDISIPGFYSTLFLRPKTDQGWRVIINLKPLNSHLVYRRFRMETTKTVRQGLSQGDYCFSLDLKDAYCHVPIFPSHRKYLRVMWKGKQWQFRTLCFGLSSAPWLFSLIVSQVAKFLHRFGIHAHFYLDDWQIFNANLQTLSMNKPFVLQVVKALGWLLNLLKCQLDISQRSLFIGADYHLDRGLVFPTEKRWVNLQAVLLKFCTVPSATASQWSSLLGMLTSIQEVTPLGRLHARDLQLHLNNWWADRAHLHTLIPVTPACRAVFRWWLRPENVMCGVPLRPRAPDVTIYTDSSLIGYGAVWEHRELSGTWSPHLQQKHINYLELLCTKIALQKWWHLLSGLHVLIASDNTTVIHYLNRQSGTHSVALHNLTKEILCWCAARNIQVSARHCPGRLNCVADGLSRSGTVIHTEWALHPAVFHTLTQIWFQPLIDLFASKFKAKCQTYISPVPDPQAYAVDSLSQPWDGLLAYAYPPPALLGQVLQKLKSHPTCRMILICPKWERMGWFTHLLDLLTEVPRQLPLRADLLKQPNKQLYHSGLSGLNLHACVLSADTSLTKAFRLRLQTGSYTKTELQLKNCMNITGPNSLFGVSQGVMIPTLPL